MIIQDWFTVEEINKLKRDGYSVVVVANASGLLYAHAYKEE